SDGAFRFAVVVQDSSGLRLLSQAWTETVGDAILRVRGASVGEHLTFAARAGRYTVEAVVTDSASGRVARQQITVEAFAAPPAASDLLLGTGLRGLEDSTVRSGEIRKGGVAVQTSGEPVLTPQAADRYGQVAEAQPDEGYDRRSCLMTWAEQGTYARRAVDGKRRWLREFWGKRDPTAGTARNEAQEGFYSLVAEANRRFREGG